MRHGITVAVVAAALALASAGTASGAVASCADVHRVKEKTSSPPYERQSDLAEVIRYLDGAACDLHLTEWAQVTYAQALESYSATFPVGSATRLSWAENATLAYERYLEWFLNLSEDAQDRLISGLIKVPVAHPSFKDERATWLRRRPGGVLNSLSALYVRYNRHSTLLAAVPKFGTKNPRIVNNEVVTEWHRWLRSQDDFARARKESEIVQLIDNSEDCRDAWMQFRNFLKKFVTMNPSVQEDWNPVLARVTRWVP